MYTFGERAGIEGEEAAPEAAARRRELRVAPLAVTAAELRRARWLRSPACESHWQWSSAQRVTRKRRFIMAYTAKLVVESRISAKLNTCRGAPK